MRRPKVGDLCRVKNGAYAQWRAQFKVPQNQLWRVIRVYPDCDYFRVVSVGLAKTCYLPRGEDGESHNSLELEQVVLIGGLFDVE